ncbi:TPA: hypothetical protein N2N40_002498 [Citrobacter freundii]|nr:hypothetical protein [Citrobacter freundii]
MMENKDKEYFLGAMWAISTMWRMHSDDIIAKDMLRELPDAHEIAKYCSEYDIQPLRLHVMDSLPLGCDAAYASISYGPVDSSDALICDHSEVPKEKKDDYSYCVYAVESNGTRAVLVVGLDGEEEAEGLAEILTTQLQAILVRKGEKEPAE